jgi:hypothetical protein
MEFIRELNESRLFRKLEYVSGRSMDADDKTFVLPELRLRRNLLALRRGDFDNNDWSYMMLMLQREFTNIPAYLYILRRQISYWDRLTKNQKSEVVQRLMYIMREKGGMQSDLYMLLQRLQKSL